MASFWFLKNLCDNSEFKMEKEVATVGRHKSHDIECRHNAISRYHAELTIVGNDFYVKAQKSLNGTYVNGRRLDDMQIVKLEVEDSLRFGFPVHPVCNEGVNHHCYTVKKHQLKTIMNTSEQLLNILEGNDISQLSMENEPPDQNNEAESSPLYSNKDDVVYIDDDDDFEAFSQKVFDERISIKAEPIECIEISDSENDDDILNFDALKSIRDNFVSNDPEIGKDENQNVAQTSNQNQIRDSVEDRVEVQDILIEKNKEDIQSNKKSKVPVDRSFIIPMKHSKPMVISPHVEVNEKKRRRSVDVNNELKKQNGEEKDKNGTKRRKSVDVNKVNDDISNHVEDKDGKKRRESADVNKINADITNHIENKDSNKRRKSIDANKVIGDISNHVEDKYGKKRRESADVNKINADITNHIENKDSNKRRKSIDANKVIGDISNHVEDKDGKKRRKSEDANKFKKGVKGGNENRNKELRITVIKRHPIPKEPIEPNRIHENVTVPKKLSFRNLDYSLPSTSNYFKTMKSSTTTHSSSTTDIPKDSYTALLKDCVKNTLPLYPTVTTKNSNLDNLKKSDKNVSNNITKNSSRNSRKNSVKENFVQDPVQDLPKNKNPIKDPRLNRKNNATTNEIPTTSNEKIVKDGDMKKILDCHVNYLIPTEPTIPPRHLYLIFNKPSIDMVLSVLGWNVVWLDEYETVQKPPPIIKNNIVKMCTHFATYKNYCNVVKPFIMLELWDHLCHGYNTPMKLGKKRFRTSIYEVAKYDRYQILRCIGYENRREKRESVKEGDVIMMHLGVRPHDKAKQAAIKCIFAYVISCKKNSLKPNDYIYADLLADNTEVSSQLHIHLVIKPFPEEVLLAKFVDATIVTHITSILREYDALMLLKKSQVFNLTLSPNVDNFLVQRNEQIVLKPKVLKGLSAKQALAIQEASTLCAGNRPGLYMIQGPPGTGKTTVIQHIIETLVAFKPDIKIVVVAPSNVTVDGIVRKLTKDKRREDLVRLGIYDSISVDLHYYFIENTIKRKMTEQILQERPEVRLDHEKLKQRAQNLRAKIVAMTNHQKDSQQLIKELKSIEHQVDNFAKDYFQDNHYWTTFHKMRQDILTQTNIICTTLNSCSRLEQYGLKIDCCIIDEASQSKETETLIPLSLGIEKIVLVGDPKQLPAVTLSKFAKDLGYGQSLMARLKKAFVTEIKEPITMLDLQFRMHPEICSYPSETFYDGMLKTASTCKKRGGLDGLAPYYVLNINKKNRRIENGYNNETEIACVVELLKAINDTIGHRTDKSYTVGVITPYNSQRKDLLVEIEKLRMPSIQITVNTVDSFQGSEKDIIILSCVRLRANSFLSDEQRLNVSLTRARRVLYVVGTNPLFDTCPTLKSLKQNAKIRKLYYNITDVNQTILKTIIVKRPQNRY